MPLFKCIIFALLTCLQPLLSFSQQKDSASIGNGPPARPADSVKIVVNSPLTSASHLLKAQAGKKVGSLKNTVRSLSKTPNTDIKQRDTVHPDLTAPYKNLFHLKPRFRFGGGYIAYNFNYRSNIDTPYVDRDVAQHNITGQLHFSVAGILPVQVNYWLRKSNSNYFRDVADVQVSFNGNNFRNQVQAAIRERLLLLSSGVADSLTEKLYVLKSLQLDKLRQALDISFGPQSLLEAREILRVPRITWDPYQPDSVNANKEDSIKKAATYLLELYDRTKAGYDSLHHEVDSLYAFHRENLRKVDRFRNMVNGGWKDFVSMKRFENKLDEYGAGDLHIPKKYRWLLGIRNFSVGRSTANYSELTAKNISVNGINFEYNSWYYFAVSAGVVNYRFRDFVVRDAHQKPQTMVLVRVGIGSLERNYFIVSAYRGQKQLFAANSANRSLVKVSGISAESRWQLNRTTWLTAEVAKSITPDFRNIPAHYSAKLDWSDRASQGLAFRLYSYVPLTNTRVEAFYKHTGANFQSFSGFQTNADLESWYIKAEQNFFKRRLRIAAALRKNEFTNPFIVQNYKSNTVFKSITASLRMRKWPVITVAYQPMSQLTYIDRRVVENRFQSLNTTLYHLYKINGVRTASTVMLNKFYNNSSDTGFIYYNATNFYWTQHFFFNSFTMHGGASYTKNSGYRLTVLDAGFQPMLGSKGALGVGVRVNSYNNDLIKVGGYVNVNLKINRKDMVFINYEHGYLPGFAHKLVRNEMATMQFVKTF